MRLQARPVLWWMAHTSGAAAVSAMPQATLVPVTADAAAALGAGCGVQLTTFPFNVGRESREARREPRWGGEPTNDLYLVESSDSEFLQISRDHFSIERDGDRFFVVDRGSACGMVVGQTRIGGHRAGGRAEVRNGDEIVVGTRNSTYVFRFDVTFND